MMNGYHVFLAFILAVSGSINTMSVKWMDMIKSTGKDGQMKEFIHPFLQANFMFAGEFLCLIVFSIIFMIVRRSGAQAVQENSLTKGSRNFNRFILLPPAIMDIAATSTMYLGLTMTNASSFQMLRGSVIIFVALLSMFLLKRKISIREWIGILFIIIALVMVGLADYMLVKSAKKTESTEVDTLLVVEPSQFKSENNYIHGDMLIIIAQLITSCQMVYEEIYVTKLDIAPMLVVGWEGIFGLSVLSVLLVPLYYIPSPLAKEDQNSSGSMENVLDAFTKINNNLLLLAPIIGLIFSIAFYNFSGISLTKEINATTRMVLDSIRILIVWRVSIALGWQEFHYFQIIGFICLLLGMLIYNNIFVQPIIDCLAGNRSNENRNQAVTFRGNANKKNPPSAANRNRAVSPSPNKRNVPGSPSSTNLNRAKTPPKTPPNKQNLGKKPANVK